MELSAPVRPPCQCAQRREALQRAKAADAVGDTETAQRERDWVKQSLIEDAAAMAKYVKERTAYLVKRGVLKG